MMIACDGCSRFRFTRTQTFPFPHRLYFSPVSLLVWFVLFDSWCPVGPGGLRSSDVRKGPSPEEWSKIVVVFSSSSSSSGSGTEKGGQKHPRGNGRRQIRPVVVVVFGTEVAVKQVVYYKFASSRSFSSCIVCIEMDVSLPACLLTPVY